MKKNSAFEGLDWLRFVLACYLVLFHTLKTYREIGASMRGMLSLGNFATTCFFVLSGFLLTWVYIATRGSKPIEHRSFIIARLSALYPLHIITFFMAIPAAFFSKHGLGSLAVRVAPLSEEYRLLNWPETVANILSHLTLTHAWNPFYMVFNAPSWSISTLLFFYLLFPFVAPVMFSVRKPAAWLVGLGCLFAAPGVFASVLLLHDPVTYGLLHRNPVLRLPLFLAGIVLCALYARREKLPAFCKIRLFNLALAGIILATCGVAAYLLTERSPLHLPFVNAGLFYLGAVSLVWMCACAPSVESGWRARWSRRLGKASLSIFALHLPLFGFMAKLEKVGAVLLHWIAADGALWGAQPNYERQLVFYPVYFVLTIYFSVLFQEKVIEPIQSYIKKSFIDKRRAIYMTNVTAIK